MIDIEAVKLITRFVMMLGSGRIVRGVVETVVPMDSLYTKVVVKSTAFAIGGMLTEATGKYTDRQIDDINEIFKGNKKVRF